MLYATGVMAGKGPGFGELADHLNLSKRTSLHVKTYWDKMKGQTVTWTAKVHDVTGGRGKAKILAINSSRRAYRGYNLVLITYDVETAADLMIGDKIRFRGELYKYKGRKGSPVIIYLNNVEFVK
jgi:hypothetical protein